VDFGGTRTRAAVIAANGAILSRADANTPRLRGPEAVIAGIVETARRALAGSTRTDFSAVAVSSPGPIDSSTGTAYDLPNILGWDVVPLATLIGSAFGVPCVAGNDASLAALAEQRWGAARGAQHVIYLTLSTGIGSGIISGGRLLEGKDHLAPHVGHIVLEPDGPLCSCGNRGCVEALASGLSIARDAEALLAQGEASSLQAQRGALTARLVAEAAGAGDPLAARLFERAATYIGIAVGNLLTVFNPEVVVAGGGLTNAGELIFAPLRAAAFARSMPRLAAGARIVRAELGDNVGLLGAFAYGLERLNAR
jgi:glucokinase